MNKRLKGLSSFPIFTSLVILSLGAVAIGKALSITDNSYYNSSVMITNLQSNSGGSGTIVFNSDSGSLVLTNAHVCGVVENGGLVKNVDSKQFSVTSYKLSKIHDLCLIQVLGNLGTSAKLASSRPDLFASATIVGHPQLYPVTVTHGNFSQRVELPVVVGYRNCSEEERTKPDTFVFCSVVGKLPVIKIYDAQLVSATIMPGSSGSPIFNDKGEVSAVVFAGSGDLGYAFSVPFEFVDRFLNFELPSLPTQVPNLVYGSKKADESEKLHEKIAEACSVAETKSEKQICKILENDLVSFK